MCNSWTFLFEAKIRFRSRDIKLFVFLWNLQISEFVTSSQALLHNASYTYAYFFWILSPIKMKFDQIILYCMTSIYNIFLADCGFIKMTIQQDLTIFHGWHISFLLFLYSTFPKSGTLESWPIWLLINWVRFLN